MGFLTEITNRYSYYWRCKYCNLVNDWKDKTCSHCGSLRGKTTLKHLDEECHLVYRPEEVHRKIHREPEDSWVSKPVRQMYIFLLLFLMIALPFFCLFYGSGINNYSSRMPSTVSQSNKLLSQPTPKYWERTILENIPEELAPTPLPSSRGNTLSLSYQLYYGVYLYYPEKTGIYYQDSSIHVTVLNNQSTEIEFLEVVMFYEYPSSTYFCSNGEVLKVGEFIQRNYTLASCLRCYNLGSGEICNLCFPLSLIWDEIGVEAGSRFRILGIIVEGYKTE